MSTDTTALDQLPIACDASAVPADQQEYWVKEIVPKLYSQVQEIQELPNGYAWRLPSAPQILLLLAEDLNMERLCCPFVHYTLEIERNRGPFWLRMTGGEGVKEFLRIAFEASTYFNPQVVKAAGLHVSGPQIDSVATAHEAIDKINERFAETVKSNKR